MSAGIPGRDPVFLEDGSIKAIILTEDSRTVLPGAGSSEPLVVYMGVDQGQCSGNDHCIMRYVFSRAYHDRNFPAFPYYFFLPDGDNSEPLGTDVCSSKDGIGINGEDHDPQSRYGDAGVGCCAHQICVNDAMAHSADSGATGCGGGGEAEPVERRPGGGEAPPAPVVSLSVNEASSATIVRGWPVLLAVGAIHPLAPAPEASAAPLTIAPPGGHWTGAIHLEVRDATGNATAWTIEPSGDLPARLVLDAARAGRAGYWITPEASAQIPAGIYTIGARLDTAGAVQGWVGQADAPPATLTVLEAPVPLPEDLEIEGALHRARYLILHGQRAAAEDVLDQLLANHPGQIVALSYKAQVRAAAGDSSGALALYSEAIDRALAADPDGEAPGDLLLLHGDLQASVVREGLPGGSPRFVRGDVNQDDLIDISDAISTLGFLFLGNPTTLDCQKSADINNDEALDISDGVALLGHLFTGGAPPASPFPACGTDPTADALPCETAPRCR